MLVDTHAHLFDEKYNEEKVNEIVNKMSENNLEKIITVSANLLDCEQNLLISKKFNNVYCTIGIHPENQEELTTQNFKKLEAFAQNEKVVAIGEIGLDYHYENFNKELQKFGLIEQIKLAYNLKLPIVIHLRDAYEDMLNILKENSSYLKYGFVVHCYSGSLEYCKELLKLGAMFSFTGNITFKNAKKAIEVIEFLPPNKIMVETDSPYLSPEPLRGTVNEPKNVNYVFNKICEIKNMNKETLDKLIRENVRNFYRI